MQILVLDIVIVRENSVPIEHHCVQIILNFITNEKTLDIHTILLSEKIAIVFFLDLILEVDSTLEIGVLRIGLLQDHVHHLCLHLESLSKIYNSTPLKIMTTMLEAFQSQQMNWKLTCIPMR